HFFRDGGGVGAEIPLIDVAVVIDDERHDPRDAILRWEGDQTEPADNVPLDDLFFSAAGRVVALRLEDPVVVAVIGRWLLPRFAVAFRARARHELADGAFFLARSGGPIEPVVLARAAHELLCV